ncbi:uncharacterized protein LOC576011 isoform X2 [Strongylocentrotus purpuratus]|nr:uncharacterized protein LOC576011 isoform X2 [Strongylocentrotus purpuratus]
MDDSGCDVVLQRNEINGNFAIPRHLCQPFGEDEVDSSRVMIPLGEDESDGSPSKTLPCSIIADLDRLGKAKNDNDDEGYHSQESEKHRFVSIQRDEESALNNNICPSLDPSLSGDATGKVLGVSMPPNYIIRSNQRRTSFSPNENGSSQQLDNAGSHVGVQVRAIPSRLSLEDSKAKNINTPYSPRSDSVLNNTSVECYRKDASSENVNENANQRTLSGLKRKCEDETPRPLDEAGVSISPRKRKERDEDDGGDDDGMITPTCMSAEPDTKRMRTVDAIPRQYPQAPLMRQQPRMRNSYDIQGQANWVVEQPRDCTFHIYQPQGSSSGGPPKQHPVEWAGMNIHQVQDEDLKAAFEASSKAISVAINWKRFARMLPVSRSPSLEKELSSLESCSGSAQDKAMAVLLRWWREENGCRCDDDVKDRLREGLGDCGLKRVVKDLDRIFKKGNP